MKVALFGGTGFVGSYILKELDKNSFDVNILARDKSKVAIKNSNVIIGNISDEKSVRETLKDADIIIYNIGIIREFPQENIFYSELHFEGVKLCISLATELNIKRFILMSANGVKDNGTEYQTTKFMAEQELKKTDLDWTIFRPSLIFGPTLHPNHPEFCKQLKDTMLNLPFPAPIFHEGLLPFNAGKFSMSPIHVQNVAEFFVSSIKDRKKIGKTYNLGGIKKMNWIEIIDLISASSKKVKWKVPAPVIFIKLIASILDRFTWFPVTKDQLTMLLEGNVVDEQYFEDFGITPIEFNEQNLSYLHQK